jgi:hypothetical protein
MSSPLDSPKGVSSLGRWEEGRATAAWAFFSRMYATGRNHTSDDAEREEEA